MHTAVWRVSGDCLGVERHAFNTTSVECVCRRSLHCHTGRRCGGISHSKCASSFLFFFSFSFLSLFAKPDFYRPFAIAENNNNTYVWRTPLGPAVLGGTRAAHPALAELPQDGVRLQSNPRLHFQFKMLFTFFLIYLMF